MSGAGFFPVAGILVGELDLDLHLLLGGHGQRLGLGLERPALDEQPPVVGERGERLPGLHLLAEPHLEFLHLEEGIARLRGWRVHGRPRHDVARLGAGDLLWRQAEELQLPPQRLREGGQPIDLVLLPGQVGGGHRAEIDEPFDAIALGDRQSEVGGGPGQFDLRVLQELADEVEIEERRARLDGLAGPGVDCRDDAGDAGGDAAVALAGAIHHRAGDGNRPPVRARHERPRLDAEVALRLFGKFDAIGGVLMIRLADCFLLLRSSGRRAATTNRAVRIAAIAQAENEDGDRDGTDNSEAAAMRPSGNARSARELAGTRPGGQFRRTV